MITVIGFFGVYCSALIGALLVDASFGVFLYQFDYFVNPNRRWFADQIPSLRYSLIIALTIMIAWFLNQKKFSGNKISDVPFWKWWVLLGILSVLVWPIAVNEPLHERFVEIYLKGLVFGYLMYKVIDTPIKLERLTWVFLMGQFYLSYLTWQTGRNSGGRVEGIGPGDSPDVNGLAAVVVSCVPLLCFYLIRGKSWQKLLALFVLAFVLNAAILASSRGAFLGLVMGMAYVGVYMLTSLVIPSKVKLQAILSMVLALGLFVYLTDSSFWDRMGTLLDVKVAQGQVTGNEGTHRVEFWKAGLELASDRPFGSGFWGFNTLGTLYMPEDVSGGRTRALHNTYVQVLVELGYLGFIFFMALLVSVYRMTVQVRRAVKNDSYLYLQTVCFGGCLVTILTTALFLDRFYAEIMYWMFMYLACFRNIYLLKKCVPVDSPFAREPRRPPADHAAAGPTSYAGPFPKNLPKPNRRLD